MNRTAFDAYRTPPHRSGLRSLLSYTALGLLLGIGGALVIRHADDTPDQAKAQITADIKALQYGDAERGAHIGDRMGALAHETVEAVSYPKTLDLKIKPGDTLMAILMRQNISADDAHDIVQALKKTYDPRKIGRSNQLEVTLDRPAGGGNLLLKALHLTVSPVKSIILTSNDKGGFFAVGKNVPLTKGFTRRGGPITGSLYETGQKAGIPANLLGEIINAYSYDVDFQRDIKNGDKLDVMYETLKTPDGTVADHGNVVYASLELGKKNVTIYRHVDKNGNGDYYTDKGESVRKALLKTPINGARISSGFGMRMHPILGYSKMHKGVDFAAATGTPIYAAGDGVIAEEGPKGGYGNYLRIKHNDKYSSAYGHISRFASGTHIGSKVRQGQVVAYVGATGRATGPHLHYEILVNNEQVNPSGVKFKTGNSLSGKDMIAFRQEIGSIKNQLAALGKPGEKKATASLAQ